MTIDESIIRSYLIRLADAGCNDALKRVAEAPRERWGIGAYTKNPVRCLVGHTEDWIRDSESHRSNDECSVKVKLADTPWGLDVITAFDNWGYHHLAEAVSFCQSTARELLNKQEDR